jgi:hypothetical protein
MGSSEYAANTLWPTVSATLVPSLVTPQAVVANNILVISNR